MATRYANQKQVTINRMEVSKKDFFLIDNSSLHRAANDLTGNGFKLYIYLMNNAAGFKLNLSLKDVSSRTGLKKGSYSAAIKELTEKGYLVQPDPTVNNWVMKEVVEEQVAEQVTEPVVEEPVPHIACSTACSTISNTTPSLGLPVEEEIVAEPVFEEPVVDDNCASSGFEIPAPAPAEELTPKQKAAAQKNASVIVQEQEPERYTIHVQPPKDSLEVERMLRKRGKVKLFDIH